MKRFCRHAIPTSLIIGIAVFGFGWIPGPAAPAEGEFFVRPDQTFNLQESIKRGKEYYATECQNCHMDNGEGLSGVYPPLAKADYMKKPVNHLIDIILKGQEGEIVVNGVKYNTPMPPQAYLSDEKTSDILNFVRNSWGNKANAVTPAMVKAQRARK
jgi:nitrite reductase (NO-forming)